MLCHLMVLGIGAISTYQKAAVGVGNLDAGLVFEHLYLPFVNETLCLGLYTVHGVYRI